MQPRIRLLSCLVAGAAMLVLAAGCASSNRSADRSSSAASVVNCGRTVTVGAPPKRAVTMNQAATEVMLALGLADRMVGTAYLDDTILPSLTADYAKVPVLAEKYPSKEALFAAEPDFVYAAYASAFDDKVAGSQDALAAKGIASYVSPVACDNEHRPEQVTFDTIFGEIADIGRLFGVEDRAQHYIAEQREQLTRVTENGRPAQGRTVLWFDSGDKDAFVGACCGAPNMIIAALGGTNVFADAPGSWGTVSWEQVVARDPDVIVLADASWSPAAAKRAELESDPATKNLAAVKAHRYVVLPFSSTTPGIRNVSAVASMAQQLRDLHLP